MYSGKRKGGRSHDLIEPSRLEGDAYFRWLERQRRAGLAEPAENFRITEDGNIRLLTNGKNRVIENG